MACPEGTQQRPTEVQTQVQNGVRLNRPVAKRSEIKRIMHESRKAKRQRLSGASLVIRFVSFRLILQTGNGNGRPAITRTVGFV